MKKFFVILSFLFVLTTPLPARADPITAAITGIVSFVGSSAVVQTIVSLALSAATSMIQRARQKKPIPPGIKIEKTLTGGTNSRSIIVGYYATAGSEAAPPMSHGRAGKTPNAFLTKVIALADFPVSELTGLIVNGEFVTFNTGVTEEYGWPLGGKYAGKGWIKFYDGNQTTADAMLVSKYGSYVRPWTADRIGTGVAYAIVTFQFDDKIHKQDPELKFELIGAKLYDLRYDSSVGGDGPQRWDDPSTWQPTLNPPVIIYNILRGIPLAGGQKYGGECSAEDLPAANWIAAMNVADEIVTTSEGDQPRYRAGFEISVADDEPADVIEELLKACSGAISEIGGVYKMRCGAPGLPVMFVTDEDFIVTKEQDYDPFPAINASINSVYCVFPHPGETWATHDAPPLIDNAYIAQDDGVELPADLQMPACPFPLQVQRNMRAWLEDDRRWRRHNGYFGPYGFILEPLDVISWTSARNGYIDKLFEIDNTSENLMTLHNGVAMREVDPADYDWSPEFELPDPVSPGSWEMPLSQAVPGWAVQSWSVKDSDGEDRRPALRCLWDGDAADDAHLLKIEVRNADTQVLVTSVTATNITDGEEIIVEGILPATALEARAIFVVDRPTEWSAWLPVVTGNIKLTDADVAFTFPDGTTPIYEFPTTMDLPEPPPEGVDVAFVQADAKLYRWDADAEEWTKNVDEDDLADGALTTAKFAAGIRPVGLDDALPALPDAAWPEGSMFVLTTDGKTYVNRNDVWSSSIAAVDISGQITNAQIAALAASKLTGSITSTQITDGAITTPKLATGAVVAGSIAAGAIIADKIAAGSVTASKLFVGDTSNLILDANIIDPAAWETGSGGRITTAVSPLSSSIGAVESLPTGGENTYSQRFQVEPGASYYVSAYNQPSDSDHNGCFLYIYFRDKENNIVANPQVQVGSTASAGQTGRRHSQAIHTAPSNAVEGYLRFRRITGGTASIYWDSLVVRRAMSGELIVDGAVTADKLAANSVVAGKIAAGAISATEIAAGAIVASKLAIGDKTNIIADSAIQDPSWWTLTSGAQIITSPSALSTSIGAIEQLSTGGENEYTPYMSIDPDADYYISLYATPSSSNHENVFAYLYFYDKGLNVVGTNLLANPVLAPGQTGRQHIEGLYHSPSNGVLSRVRFRRISGGTASIYWDSINLRRASSGELIVDGAITAGKIATGAVTTDKLTAGAVTAAKINVTTLAAITANLGTITAGTLAVGSGGVVIRSAASGARIEISNSRILISDG